jgi:hypothetical protein
VANPLATLLNKNVVFIFSGKMTAEQRLTARERTAIRVEYVMKAVRGLILINKEWEGISLEDIEETITRSRPVVYDHSELEEETGDSNIENQESFSVYFPDNTMTSMHGGQSSAERFNNIVSEAQSQGFEGEIVSELNRDFTSDYIGQSFVNSCLLQMPFGRGGPTEDRIGSDGSLGDSHIELAEYAEHLSYLSQPQFHHPLFVLKLFNMKLRGKMLRSACQQLGGRRSVASLRSQLDPVNLSNAAAATQHGQTVGSWASHQFIRSVDAMSRALPHTNDAAKQARGKIESMQHNFGLPGIFFTVTPDDVKCYLIQVYS